MPKKDRYETDTEKKVEAAIPDPIAVDDIEFTKTENKNVRDQFNAWKAIYKDLPEESGEKWTYYEKNTRIGTAVTEIEAVLKCKCGYNWYPV